MLFEIYVRMIGSILRKIFAAIVAFVVYQRFVQYFCPNYAWERFRVVCCGDFSGGNHVLSLLTMSERKPSTGSWICLHAE